MPFYLVWQRDDRLLRGHEGQAWVDGKLTFPITFPGHTTDPVPVTLRSSARDSLTFETLMNVRLYLTGTDVPLVQETWPYYGDAFTPARPELNGGFEVSFDNGHAWSRFSKEVGHASDAATWLLLPAGPVGFDGIAGQLRFADQAHLLVRYTIPPQAADFKVLDIQLAVDCDIV